MMIFAFLYLVSFLAEDIKLPEKLDKKSLTAAIFIMASAVIIFLSQGRMKTAELGYGKDKESLYAVENALYELKGGSTPDARFMDKDTGLQINYPLVADVASASSWESSVVSSSIVIS